MQRRRLRTLLGPDPPSVPLDPRVLATHEEPTHTRLLVDYAVESGERVQAFLLLPRTRPVEVKVPGVLAIHQDGGRRPYAFGKSEVAGLGGDRGLAYGRELAERGFAVLCPDRPGFESRSLADSPFRETFARFRIRKDDGLDLTEDLYKGALANRLLFAGRTPLGKELHDLRRGLDLLAARPEVDPARLGAMAHSAGRQLTALLMYLDRRVRAGAASCGTFLDRSVYGRPDFLRPINGFAGFVVPGMAGWGDLDDVLAGLAPRPFLETSGDVEDEEEVADLIGKARARYAGLGLAERYAYVVRGDGHSFPPAERERAYRWLDRWLRPPGPGHVGRPDQTLRTRPATEPRRARPRRGDQVAGSSASTPRTRPTA